MSKFKVGDVCVIVGYDRFPELVGMECTIVSDERDFICSAVRGPEHVVFGFRVELSGMHPVGKKFCIERREYLRLRRPPSWDSWLYDTRDVEREQSTQPATQGPTHAQP